MKHLIYIVSSNLYNNPKKVVLLLLSMLMLWSTEMSNNMPKFTLLEARIQTLTHTLTTTLCSLHSSQSPSHTTAALKQAAEKAPAHCLAPAMAPAEISSCDYLSLEWPEALPRPHPGPRPGASSLPPSNCSCTSFPGLLGHTSCLTAVGMCLGDQREIPTPFSSRFRT